MNIRKIEKLVVTGAKVVAYYPTYGSNADEVASNLFKSMTSDGWVIEDEKGTARAFKVTLLVEEID